MSSIAIAMDGIHAAPLSFNHVDIIHERGICVGSRCTLQVLSEDGLKGQETVVVVVADHGDHLDVESEDGQRMEVFVRILEIATNTMFVRFYKTNG